MTLGDRIAQHLADLRAETVPEIARAVVARDIDVRRALESDARFEKTCDPPTNRSRRARCWRLVPRPENSSQALSGAVADDEPSVAPAPSEPFWAVAVYAGPRSVGEAVRWRKAA